MWSRKERTTPAKKNLSTMSSLSRCPSTSGYSDLTVSVYSVKISCTFDEPSSCVTLYSRMGPRSTAGEQYLIVCQSITFAPIGFPLWYLNSRLSCEKWPWHIVETSFTSVRIPFTISIGFLFNLRFIFSAKAEFDKDSRMSNILQLHNTRRVAQIIELHNDYIILRRVRYVCK